MERIEAGREDWILSGKDDDGTPVFIDTNSITRDLDDPYVVKLWIKLTPVRTSRAHERVRTTLRKRGKPSNKFDHLKQAVEIDYTGHRSRTLHLVMCERTGKTLDVMNFYYPEWVDIKQGGVFDTVQAAVKDVASDVVPEPPRAPVERGYVRLPSVTAATPSGAQAAREPVAVIPPLAEDSLSSSAKGPEEPAPRSKLRLEEVEPVQRPAKPVVAVPEPFKTPFVPAEPAPREPVKVPSDAPPEPRRVVTAPVEELTYGSAGRRAAAALCDFAFVILPVFALLHFWGPLEAIMFAIIAGCLYWPSFEGSGLQGTPGKKIFDLKVADLDGEKISFEKALVRHLLGLVCVAVLFAGMVPVIFTARRQGLHDMAMKTVVIRG
jgi:uncharacterized RDD family membrane protein YckC